LALANYEQETGLHPTVWLVEPSDGVRLQIGAERPVLLRDWLTPAKIADPAPACGPVGGAA
jgi:hypothetical protein